MSRADVLPGLCYCNKYLRILVLIIILIIRGNVCLHSQSLGPIFGACGRNNLVGTFGGGCSLHGGQEAKKEEKGLGSQQDLTSLHRDLPSKGCYLPVATSAGAKASTHTISIAFLVTGTKYLKTTTYKRKGLILAYSFEV